MKVVIIAPEPGAWLALALAGCPDDVDVEIYAPWATRFGWSTRLPGAMGRYCSRRRLNVRTIHRQFGWTFKDIVRKLRTGHDVDRLMTYRFTVRAELDEHVASRLTQDTQVLIGPSLSCLKSFERASTWPTRLILVEDIPNIETLHDDLDRAAIRHPQRSFLRRFRASHAQIQHQKTERAIAQAVAVRGWFAKTQSQKDRGAPPALFAWNLPPEPGVLGSPRRDGGCQVALAGGASARNGFMEALGLLDTRADLTLWVRPSEGLMPATLIDHPQIRTFRGLSDLPKELDCVLAPSWCESYTPEVSEAIRRGLPVIGTLRGVGFLDTSSQARLVEPGDRDQLESALREALTPKDEQDPANNDERIRPEDFAKWSDSFGSI